MRKVGPKGQVVIAKEIRDELGIEPGWLALQRVVDGHVELNFLPPEHDESLKGILAPYANGRTASEAELNRAAEGAWHDAVEEELIILAEGS